MKYKPPRAVAVFFIFYMPLGPQLIISMYISARIVVGGFLVVGRVDAECIM